MNKIIAGINKPSVATIAKFAGVSEQRIRDQFAANAKQLRECEQAAIIKGGKYRGYVASQWSDFAKHAESMACAS